MSIREIFKFEAPGDLLSWMGWEITGFRGSEKEPSLARRKAEKRSRTMLRSITFFSSLASCSSSRLSASVRPWGLDRSRCL